MKPGCPTSYVEGGDLTPLDKDRARSMADEGGVSAAVIEGEDPCTPSELAKLINDGTEPLRPRGGKNAGTQRRRGAQKK